MVVEKRICHILDIWIYEIQLSGSWNGEADNITTKGTPTMLHMRGDK